MMMSRAPAVAGLLQPAFQLVHVRVGEAIAFGLAQPHPVDDRGVVQAVGDDGVVLAQQGFEQAAVGVEGGGEQDGVLETQIAGDGRFQLLVDLQRAADEADRGRAGAPLLLSGDPGLDDPLVARQAQIVVGAEVQHVAAGDLDHRPLARGDDAFGLGQALGVDLGQFAGDAVVEALGHGRDLRRFRPGFHPSSGRLQVAVWGSASARIGLTRILPPHGWNSNGRLTAAVSPGAVARRVAALGQVFCIVSSGTTVQATSK
jgi:hypothetical protein